MHFYCVFPNKNTLYQDAEQDFPVIWRLAVGSKDGKKVELNAWHFKKSCRCIGARHLLHSVGTEATMMLSVRTTTGPDLHPSLENEWRSGHSTQQRGFSFSVILINFSHSSKSSRYLFLLTVLCHYKQCCNKYPLKVSLVVYFYF